MIYLFLHAKELVLKFEGAIMVSSRCLVQATYFGYKVPLIIFVSNLWRMGGRL